MYLGDNLAILKQLPDESVDLIYIDPPFNTGRTQERKTRKSELSQDGTAGFKGKNLAAILLRESLADIRSRGKEKVVPVCSYTVRYMEKHPETQDLLLNPIEDAIADCRWYKK